MAARARLGRGGGKAIMIKVARSFFPRVFRFYSNAEKIFREFDFSLASVARIGGPGHSVQFIVV